MIKDDEELIPGAWISMEYDGKQRKFYVLESNEEMVLLGTKTRLVGDALWFGLDMVIQKAYHIGYSGVKWYWKYLPWKDKVCPYKEHIYDF